MDTTPENELLSFMDAFLGYNQILMHTDVQKKTVFITERGIFYYKVMPFGLKNTGATYQRLLNRMFTEQLNSTMDVYIDDMLFKSLDEHLDHLCQAFEGLKKYNMNLNPTKCSFGVASGKFLSYMVTQYGIEASPNFDLWWASHLQHASKMSNTLGRVAALNQFISKSSKKYHLLFATLHKSKGFEWTLTSEEAF